MLKTYTRLALGFVFAAVLCGSVPAEAKNDGPKFCRDGRGHPVHGWQWCANRGYTRHYVHGRRQWVERPQAARSSAWSIVRRDPCLWDQYSRFAREHKNPNKRARFVERLAREGCDEPERYYGRGYYRDDDPYRYGYQDRRRYYYDDRSPYDYERRSFFDFLF